MNGIGKRGNRFWIHWMGFSLHTTNTAHTQTYTITRIQNNYKNRQTHTYIHTTSSMFSFSLFLLSLLSNTDLILAYLQMGFSQHTKLQQQQHEISFKLHQNYYNCLLLFTHHTPNTHSQTYTHQHRNTRVICL